MAGRRQHKHGLPSSVCIDNGKAYRYKHLNGEETENKISLKIKFAIGKKAGYLKMSLEDFVWGLNKILRKKGLGSASGVFEEGVFIVVISGASIETVNPYLDVWVKSLREKENQRFFFNIVNDTEQIENLDTFGNRDKDLKGRILTKCILTGCSIQEAAD